MGNPQMPDSEDRPQNTGLDPNRSLVIYRGEDDLNVGAWLISQAEQCQRPLLPTFDPTDVGHAPQARAITGAPSVIRPYLTDELNSRLSIPLPKGRWEIQWRTPVLSEHSPLQLTQALERILLIYGGWPKQLFDRTGKLLSSNLGDGYLPLMDPQSPRLYLAGQSYLRGFSLEDSSSVFQYNPGLMGRFQYLLQRPSRFLTAGSSWIMHPHGGIMTDDSRLVVSDLGSPPKADGMGFLTSVHVLGELLINTSRMTVAAHGDTLVFAVPNHIFYVDMDLKLLRAFSGTFEPNRISLDEGGRVFLAAGEPGHPEILAISGQQTLSWRTSIPVTAGALLAPPIIGYDHRVYWLGQKQLVALSPKGDIHWTVDLVAPSGALVTGDNRLLVADGERMLVFDQTNRPVELVHFPGEKLCTNPVLTPDGELIVATDKKLYCLKVKN